MVQPRRPGPGQDAPEFDILCLSHLRWDFVFQRPQHLLTRFAQQRRVFFVEEPIFGPGPARLEVSQRADRLWVVVPHLPWGMEAGAAESTQRELLDAFLAEHGAPAPVVWYYTPMALPLAQNVAARAVVYDCMDELSAFRGAPEAMLAREAELLRRADLVFTGGWSLYESKRHRHPSVHPFPSGIDVAHFARARRPLQDPVDQAAVAHPRIGFFGVLDERLDIRLIGDLARARPDWSLVLIGPVVKIDPAELPRHANIHYLGPKSYDELPEYLAGWDVAALFFARNEATRYISPTKTPEYLAAGKPVVSTPIPDVVRAYGEPGLVQIAGTVEEWIDAVELALRGAATTPDWQQRIDHNLAKNTWDRVWAGMNDLLESVVRPRESGWQEDGSPRKREPGRLAATAEAGFGGGEASHV